MFSSPMFSIEYIIHSKERNTFETDLCVSEWLWQWLRSEKDKSIYSIWTISKPQ